MASAARPARGIDPKPQIAQGNTVCLVSCQRSPEPVYLRWKGVEKAEGGDLYVREWSGDGAVGGEGRGDVRRHQVRR